MDTHTGAVNNRYSQEKKESLIGQIVGAVALIAVLILLANILPAII